MAPESLTELLEQLQRGEIDVAAVSARLHQARGSSSAITTDAHVDIDRHRRCGFPEVVYCEGKSAQSIVEIFEAQLAENQDCFGTRISEQQATDVLKRLPQAEHNPVARTIRIRRNGTSASDSVQSGKVALISAGTSDLPVVEEAAETLNWMSCQVEMIFDVGVAGPHRLQQQLQRFVDADAIVVVAGMEGALPSVVGGFVDCPVIAVPTSVGYGASFGGVAALLGMLNSCASNVTVVNIDAGFKGGYVAGLIANHAAR